ncbi:MAG: prolipoprotein diacylglyceryl transferase [Frankia sp.]|nr:prolipoprotein diacylglyceryl transferase [Frankia sp.]
MTLAAIPSPSRGVVHLGPLPLRAYALMIILGIVVATWLTARRLAARGIAAQHASDIAVWAVLFGIVGARLYHVVSTPAGYFGENGHPLDALKVWEGGLAVWGAIAGGALGCWIATRRRGIPFLLFADAIAPGLAIAQAIGRWGNWFNQELFGRPTDLPWALEISPEHRPRDYVNEPTFHPTFLYESLWCLGVAAVLLAIDRRRRLGRGRLFALYIMLYTAGRVWIELLRVDTAEHVLGLRVNVWVSILVFLGGLAMLVLVRRPVDPDVTAASAGAGRDGEGDGSAAAPPGQPGAQAAASGGADDAAPAGAVAVEARPAAAGTQPDDEARLGGAARADGPAGPGEPAGGPSAGS